MTTLYLAVPNDDSYYMYCDEAYKYNEIKNRVGFPLFNINPVDQNIGLLDFGISRAAAFKNNEPRAFWLSPNPHTPTAYVCEHRLVEPSETYSLIGTIRKCHDSSSILPVGSTVYQLVSSSARPWARIVVVRTEAEINIKTAFLPMDQ